MRVPRPSALMLITGALLILLPMLAMLQYRWVGQVAEADRERMGTHLHNAGQQFREALDGEIARAFVLLQVGTTVARDGSSERYADRYDTWLSTAAHPQIVANVLVVDADGPVLRLRRWDPTARALVSADWSPALQAWRPQFEQGLVSFRAGRSAEWRAPGSPDESLLIAPLRPFPPPLPGQPMEQPGFGLSILQLDLGYVRARLLPELAQSYFNVSDANGYRVAVASSLDPKTVWYRSGPDAPVTPDRADAVEPLFGIRGDALFFARGVDGRGGDGRRNELRGAMMNLFREGEQGRGFGGFNRDLSRWILYAQHQSGSLEEAVARVRRRNVGISFGILLLLSVSIGTLAVSSTRAHRLARQQMEFVAGVSHELRTPIAVIRSAAENLSLGVIGSPDRVKRYGDAIGSEARRLGEMVERVLQYAGLESGRATMTSAPLAPADIVESAVEEAAPLVKSAGVELERHIASDLPHVLGDAVALRSAVQNLIANAVKYGGADRWLRVGVTRWGEGRRAEVRIAVEDHGAGIPAPELPHIFDPFYRGADAIARQIQGNGLGLSIVQRVIAAHGGRILVATRPGAGSTFTIVLPAVYPTAAEAVMPQDTPTLDAPGSAPAHS